MSIKFLSIQGSYQTLEVSLFEDKKLIDTIQDNNKKASSTLIPHINKLLKNNNLKLNNLSFMAIDQGPGALTSLRVAITTINAISFESQVPLIGIDGLDAIAHEALPHTGKIIALLNAYNNDVYYGIFKANDIKLTLLEPKDYTNIDNLTSKISKNTIFIGNAAILYQDKLGPNIIMINEASSKTIGLLALNKWEKQVNLKQKLLPLYLKTQNFNVKQ